MNTNSINLKIMVIFFLIIALFSCKNEQPKADGTQQATTETSTPDTSKANEELTKNVEIPDACTIITDEAIKKIFHVKSNVAHVNISSGLKPYSRTCSFYWDEVNAKSNIIIQIQHHTKDSGLGESANAYIQNLVNVGMVIGGEDNPIPYNAFDAAGKPGAFSFQQSRCFWAANDQYSFMIVVNVQNADEKAKSEMLYNLAKELNANLAKL